MKAAASKSRQFENYAGQMIEKMQSIFNDIEVRTKKVCTRKLATSDQNQNLLMTD